MLRHCTAFCAAAALAWGPIGNPRARAYEDQASLDAAPGYALVVDGSGRTLQGPSLDVGGGVGLSDLGILRASAGYAALFADGTLRHAGRARVEALYLLDVLRFVPFFGLGASLVALGAGGPAREPRSARQAQVWPGGHLVFGVDYLQSRTWIFGLDVRSGFLLDGSRLRSATDVCLRVSRMFETF